MRAAHRPTRGQISQTRSATETACCFRLGRRSVQNIKSFIMLPGWSTRNEFEIQGPTSRAFAQWVRSPAVSAPTRLSARVGFAPYLKIHQCPRDKFNGKTFRRQYHQRLQQWPRAAAQSHTAPVPTHRRDTPATRTWSRDQPPAMTLSNVPYCPITRCPCVGPQCASSRPRPNA